MTRRLLSFALALSCVWGVDALTPSVSCPAQLAPRVLPAFADPESTSMGMRGKAAFWQRLGRSRCRELLERHNRTRRQSVSVFLLWPN